MAYPSEKPRRSLFSIYYPLPPINIKERATNIFVLPPQSFWLPFFLWQIQSAQLFFSWMTFRQTSEVIEFLCMHLVIGACNSHSSSSISNFNSAKYKMENEKKNKTSPIPHANDNGDRLTNLQYFLRLASSSSLGRSKAASALSLYFFFC